MEQVLRALENEQLSPAQVQATQDMLQDLLDEDALCDEESLHNHSALLWLHTMCDVCRCACSLCNFGRPHKLVIISNGARLALHCPVRLLDECVKQLLRADRFTRACMLVLHWQ